MGREWHLILLRLTLDTFIPKYYIVSMMSTNRSLASLNTVQCHGTLGLVFFFNECIYKIQIQGIGIIKTKGHLSGSKFNFFHKPDRYHGFILF